MAWDECPTGWLRTLPDGREYERSLSQTADRLCRAARGESSFGVPRVTNWRLFDGYGFEDTLREMMKLEYIYEGDGDDVDRNNLMKEKYIWFRLCGHEHILTLPKFAVVLGLFTEEE
ncbi:hypothetical protein Tco_1495011, partial [Tanacetum coccineum]